MTKEVLEGLEEFYQREKVWGISSMIDLHNCDPRIIRDADEIKRFVVELCDLIKMRRFGKCVVVDFGEDEEVAGFSMAQLIETSLISGHFANKTNRVFLDVFSCKFYEPKIVAEFAKKFFKAKSYNLDHQIRK